MLRHLRATNFAILSDVEIELGVGMNVLTGETDTESDTQIQLCINAPVGSVDIEI